MGCRAVLPYPLSPPCARVTGCVGRAGAEQKADESEDDGGSEPDDGHDTDSDDDEDEEEGNGDDAAAGRGERKAC